MLKSKHLQIQSLRAFCTFSSCGIWNWRAHFYSNFESSPISWFHVLQDGL